MTQSDPDARAAVLVALARRVFPFAQAIGATRVREGGSTEVYRIVADAVVAFVRVLPEQGQGFASEALAHQLLYARGLRVPKVLYVEHRNPTLDRAVMITDAVLGEPFGHGADAVALGDALAAAGRELALLGSLPVVGWGWIARAAPTYTQLAGAYATHDAWLDAEFAAPVGALVGGAALLPGEAERLEARFAAHRRAMPGDGPVLAHGDYDASHLYHANGRYAGLIDFGEIRGADTLYDLGHFAVENAALLPALLSGYHAVAPLPADAAARIASWRLLIAARRLGRQLLKRAPTLYAPDLAVVHEELED